MVITLSNLNRFSNFFHQLTHRYHHHQFCSAKNDKTYKIADAHMPEKHVAHWIGCLHQTTCLWINTDMGKTRESKLPVKWLLIIPPHIKRVTCPRSIYCKILQCGPMPNVMVALPNIGGALCSTPQSLDRAHAQVPCSNATKIREPKTWRMQSEFWPWQNSVMDKKPQNCICSVPAQETAKHRAKFGWLPLSDVAAVTKPRRESR